MGELLSSAPLCQNVRKHTTNVGEILCTGNGCVACNPKKNGSEKMVQILGDIDTVDFERGSKNEETSALKTRERSTTSPGCYGDNIYERRAGKREIKKKTKKRAERLPSSEVKTVPQILVTGFPQNYEKKIAEKSAQTETFKLSVKKFVKNVTPVGKQGTRTDLRRYLTAPSRSKILPLKQKAAKKIESSDEKESGKSSQVIKNVTFRKRPLYHTFPRAHGTISQGKDRNNNSQEENTSFLEMLKTSEVGIYESNMMKVNASSVWVEKILRQGVKEEQLLPRISRPRVSERKSGDGSELETTDKITQTPNATTTGILPRVSFNGKVEVRGGESVLIIEHEHEKIEKDKVLYRVGFALEGQVKRSRNFPKVSIIEIADSLGEFVEMGVIKVIQRRNKRWLILVEGKVTKDFLLQNGVVLGGRYFELIELKTF